MRLIIVLLTILTLTACERIALLSTPKKTPRILSTDLANHAEQRFWDVLHRGAYPEIDNVIELLTAAYLQNPFNPRLAAHLAFLHIWKITERAQLGKIPATIVNEIVLARKYFADAIELDPGDARYQGFFGDSQLMEGKIFADERLQVQGYFQLRKAIHMWPAFNYFSAGYPMSILPPNNKLFKEGLKWQWETLNICVGVRVNRRNPDFTPFLSKETQQGKLRACWNSWIAPHNFEGFFMNMGDMLVKAGDWQTAVKIYNNAKLSKSYQEWPFRTMLENRIRNAEQNVGNFNKKSGFNQAGPVDPDKTILFNSGYGCAVCHQTR